MGFAITSAVLGGIIIIAYSIMIGNASYSRYYYGYNYYDYDPYGYPTTVTYRDHRYSYGAKMALAAVILILGIIEFGTGIWVSICLCVMKPCCTDYQVSFLLSEIQSARLTVHILLQATITTTVSFICMTITIQHCKSIESMIITVFWLSGYNNYYYYNIDLYHYMYFSLISKHDEMNIIILIQG